MAELNNTESTEGVSTETTSTEKTYTQAEVDDMLQRETDRRISSALKKQEEKNAQKIKEAQKLANMDVQQRYEYELSQRELAIQEKEKALTLAENKAICSKILAERGLSQDLVTFVVCEDADTMNSNIKIIEKAFKKSVSDEVNKRLGSNAPKQSTIDVGTMSKDQFKKTKDYTVLMEMKRNNPELWEQYSKDLY